MGGECFFNRELNRRLGVADGLELVLWELDREAGLARTQGYNVPLRPFLGILGLSPGAPGEHVAWFPGPTGGNMDCRELVEGSVLYLPVEAEGGLVSLGDAHAAQGDGEVAGMAIECPLEEVVLGLDLVSDWPIRTPHLRNSEAWVTLGFSRELDEAVEVALNAMLDLMVRQRGVTRHRALALASACVDVRVTQLVNGVRGAHARWPHPVQG